jgi:malate permease and related proteins
MIEILQIFVDNIAPILVIAGIAFYLGRQFDVDPKPLGRILFNVLSPALVFQSISTSKITGSELVQIFIVVTIFVVLLALLAYGIMRWRGESTLHRASVMLGATCANNGNFGLPLISFAFGSEVFTRAVIVFMSMTILNYTSGVFIASGGRKSSREAFTNILHVPAIYAAALGLLVNFTHITLPPLLARPVLLLSQATVPMMLTLLGLQLALSPALTHLRLVGVGVALRLLISPLLAAALALVFGLDAPSAVAVIMQLSMPTAVVTIIFANEFDLDRQVSLSMVLASTLLSPVTLSILIYVLRRVLVE